jgi:hypothetical protein
LDPYAQRIRLRELCFIASSPRNGGEDTVEAYYGWQDARASMVAKGLGAAAVSILTAWFVPFLKTEFKHSSLWLSIVTPVAAPGANKSSARLEEEGP